jgi:outer membrane protein OmpA-like peptidoglycan-associated protein
MPRSLPRARRSTVAFVALAALAFPACSGGNLAGNLAKPPEFAPKDQSKCGVTKSQAEPLIVEWPDAARGRLEALLRRGVVAVHYSGCEMEVLGQCSAKGRYSYASFTPKRSNVKMRDADELYANIPAYAVKFEAALQKAGELNVSMMIVGRYEADHAGFRAEELEGNCEGATHIVNALTVGAFDFFAGADASVGAGVSGGDAGAGAKSSSKRETLNQDGDATACANSKRDDKEPPFGCGALIRVEVIPIVGARPAATARHEEPTKANDDPPADAPSAPVSKRDGDGDGVPDMEDVCPTEPGPASTNLHENGCPPKKVVMVTGSSIRITEIIHFGTATAKIAPESAASIDNVAQLMKSHPEIKRLDIQGHTDNKGSEAAATRLTQDRADAVKKALTSRGVAESRLTATGYGSSKPIASNSTDVGRAQNRRVEFVVIQ